MVRDRRWHRCRRWSRYWRWCAAWQAGSTYVALQSANDPANIEARNEARFTEISEQVSTRRHDDMQRCMDRFEAEAGVSEATQKTSAIAPLAMVGTGPMAQIWCGSTTGS